MSPFVFLTRPFRTKTERSLYEKSTESLPEGWVAFIHPDPDRDPNEKIFYVNVESEPSKDPTTKVIK